jgi:hypothetical protein
MTPDEERRLLRNIPLISRSNYEALNLLKSWNYRDTSRPTCVLIGDEQMKACIGVCLDGAFVLECRTR